MFSPRNGRVICSWVNDKTRNPSKTIGLSNENSVYSGHGNERVVPFDPKCHYTRLKYIAYMYVIVSNGLSSISECAMLNGSITYVKMYHLINAHIINTQI